jgi:hypothetical protein
VSLLIRRRWCAEEEGEEVSSLQLSIAFIVRQMVCGCLRRGHRWVRRAHGHLNGRFWVLLDDMHKVQPGETTGVIKRLLLMRMKDAVEEVATPEQRATYIAESLHVEKIGEALDGFYQTPENLPVPIVWALRVVALRAKGADLAEVERVIAQCRKAAR